MLSISLLYNCQWYYYIIINGIYSIMPTIINVIAIIIIVINGIITIIMIIDIILIIY